MRKKQHSFSCKHSLINTRAQFSQRNSKISFFLAYTVSTSNFNTLILSNKYKITKLREIINFSTVYTNNTFEAPLRLLLQDHEILDHFF